LNSIRPTLGEKLILRLEKRLRRRPRIGFSPGFYARFGLEDPWMADSFGGDPLQQDEAFTHVSGPLFMRISPSSVAVVGGVIADSVRGRRALLA
jgi:hypothetical protein